MLSVLLVIIGVGLVAYALGYRLSLKWDAVTAFGTGVWSGLKALAIAPVTSIGSLVPRVAAVLGILLIVVALLTGTGNAPAPSAPSLKDAIVAFQIEHGLNGDGVWGPKTEAAYRLFIKRGY